MSGAKSELRKYATALLATISLAAISLSAASLPASAHEGHPQEAATGFLLSKFVDGKALDGFSPGTPDYGFTLEAILQIDSAGISVAQQKTAIDEVIKNQGVVASYLEPEGGLAVGLLAKYLFVAKILGSTDAEFSGWLSKLETAVPADGAITGFETSTFTLAWSVLALEANGRSDLANLVAKHLATLAQSDGGFNSGDEFATPGVGSSDATGIVLQALATQLDRGTPDAKAKLQSTIDAAAAFLASTQQGGNHWLAFGDVDVNGTAYAAMGLDAIGQDTEAIAIWIESQQASDGGIKTPWSQDSGDAFATAQAISPMLQLSYVDLLAASAPNLNWLWILLGSLAIGAAVATSVILIIRKRRK